MWKHACAFSKWTPTNQYLHSIKDKQNTVNWKELDLSRFGFIGSDKLCYWGLIAVLWQKPLPVLQVKTQSLTQTETEAYKGLAASEFLTAAEQ